MPECRFSAKTDPKKKGRITAAPFSFYIKLELAQRAGDFLACENLDHIAWANVLIILKRHATFLT